MVRVLLIDGDVLAYTAAAAVEKAIEWEPGYWTWSANEEEARDKFKESLDALMDKLDAHEYRIALSDDQVNFRKAILPTYKGNRANVKKPLVLKAIRQWLLDDYAAMLKPTLEGDDILGILATHPTLVPGEKIIVSIDKDMKTIPGAFFRTTEDEVVEYSEVQADYWHMFQTLTGDTTDGYGGCPGIGPKKAAPILDAVVDDALASMADDTARREALWAAVVKTYEKAKLNEAAALQQARVARILRASDYDFKRKAPKLWRS